MGTEANEEIKKGLKVKKLCIYHGGCLDGFTAAWALHKADPEGVEYYAASYQEDPPDVKDKIVFILDFSYRRPVMESIIRDAKTVVVLDHHKSAMKDLEDLKGADIHFDMDRSGAAMAWDHFHPGRIRPMLINHVQDRDLWLFKHYGTREIMATVSSYEYTFENWDTLMNTSVEDLYNSGLSILRKHLKDVRDTIKLTKTRMRLGGYDIPVANVPMTMSSEAGNMLCANEPFSATYFKASDGSKVFSLRSQGSNAVDVSEIANKYGGGGHKNAAGFKSERF